jgi:hypothetical protein
MKKQTIDRMIKDLLKTSNVTEREAREIVLALLRG